jgi:hypothetical protein
VFRHNSIIFRTFAEAFPKRAVFMRFFDAFPQKRQPFPIWGALPFALWLLL